MNYGIVIYKKGMKALYLALLCGMWPGTEVRAAQADSVRVAWTDSTLLTVAFPVSAEGAALRSDYRLIVTPYICGDDGHELELSPVEFAGKRKLRYDRRAAHLAGASYNALPVGETLDYKAEVPVQEWMKHTPLRVVLRRETEGCCRTSDLPEQTLATSRYVPPFQPVFADIAPRLSTADRVAEDEPALQPIEHYRPYDRHVPLRRVPGAVMVYFPVNKHKIDPDFRDNRAALQRIERLVALLRDDTLASVAKVLIVGLASPEGPIAFNEKLAGRRAEALRDYIANRAQMPDSLFEVANGGEAWADLRDVVAESNLPERDEILSIIDGTPDADRREQLLRRLNGGKPFRYLKQQAFADQRNSGYVRVYYATKPDVEGETINRAVDLLRAGQCDEALRLLRTVQHDPRSLNALGTACYMTGRKAEALDCYRRAAALGDEDARRNAEQLARQLGE